MSNTHNEIGFINADGTITSFGSTGGGGSSSGGHTIIDANGTEMPAESKLQFGEGFSATDDSTNGKTIITPDSGVLTKQEELSNLVLTGTTNTSGGAISAGTCFVLNGDFVTAKADIASGATFTLNTNYEKKSVGSILTELNSNKIDKYSGSATISLIVTFPEYSEWSTNKYYDTSSIYFPLQPGTTETLSEVKMKTPSGGVVITSSCSINRIGNYISIRYSGTTDVKNHSAAVSIILN